MIIPGLIELCENFLKSDIAVDNVCELWLLSEQYKAHNLWTCCKFFVWLEFDSVSKTEGFGLLTKELLEEIEPLLGKK